MMDFIFGLLVGFVVYHFTFNRLAAKRLSEWQNWVDQRHTFLSDQEVRDLADESIEARFTGKIRDEDLKWN